ncbi:orphan sodium- and chloride-dependent neurotransmitter transporter NTT5 [Ochotona curzoniae]|uniref:orphan sodium- and chloride-dependent neurotransmitter transporter NTT5 n=1 Tax=Ochotona curzoniae TaxID=130825 RepID=UPI001B34D37F|nr:orphan sodium- and chloride-dependent neurotransmitter transporter NTT5 [Ochotona curzoniae]
MSSLPEGDPHLGEAARAPVIWPEMTSEAQEVEYVVSKSSSIETKLSEGFGGILAWEDEGAAAAVSEAQATAARAARAQVWEAHASEAKSRTGHLKHVSELRMRSSSLLKRIFSNEEFLVDEEGESKALTRPIWSGKVEYILAQLGYNLKPSNIWWFVSLWLHCGGCDFLLIYILLLFLVGIPLLLLELAAGQRLHRSSVALWKVVSPWSSGVGYSSFMVCFFSSMYLNVVNAWFLFYLSQSIQSPAPWEICPLLKNASDFDPACARTTPSMYFWYQQTLKASDRFEDGGPPVRSLTLPLFVAWCLVGIFVSNGIKSVGKVMCVLIPLPYFMIVCFLFWSLLLDGATYGLKYLVVAQVSPIYNVRVWSLIGCQVLFNLGLGFGPVASLSSHMDPSNNCLSDAFVVAVINLFTMLVTTPFIFSVLGFRATVLTHRCSEKNVEMLVDLVAAGQLPPEAQPPTYLQENPSADYSTWLEGLPQVLRQQVHSKVPQCSLKEHFLQFEDGRGFVFLAFLEAMSFLPGSTLWSTLFFVMLLVLTLSTMVGFLQGIMLPLQDAFCFLRRHKKLFAVSISLLMFLCSLFFIRPPGVYFITLMNNYWIILPIIIIVMCENMAIMWAYGARRFLEDVRVLVGHPVSPLYYWLWCSLCPAMLLLMFVTVVVSLATKNLTYTAWNASSSREELRWYPSWARALMILLWVLVIGPIPAHLVYNLLYDTRFRAEMQGQLTSAPSALLLRSQMVPRPEASREEHLQDGQTEAAQPVA